MPGVSCLRMPSIQDARVDCAEVLRSKASGGLGHAAKHYRCAQWGLSITLKSVQRIGRLTSPKLTVVALGAGLYYKAMARANIAVVLLLALALVAASSIDAARVVPAGSSTASRYAW